MFHVKPAGGAGGNRTPDLCSAIETASGKSGAISGAFPIQQSRKSALKARFADQFSRTIAGRALDRLGPSRWAVIGAWLAYEIAVAVPAWAVLGPIVKAEWSAVFAALGAR